MTQAGADRAGPKRLELRIASVITRLPHAKVAELADALDSGFSARKGVEVRVLFFARARLRKEP